MQISIFSKKFCKPWAWQSCPCPDVIISQDRLLMDSHGVEGLTIEPGKHYSQTVEQSFHVSMAALDTREKSGMTQLLVRHEKAEFLLCTLQVSDGQSFPCYQQALNLNLTEGSEISFYSEGKGTIHLTGYLVNDEPIGLDSSLLSADGMLVNEEDESDEEEDEVEDEEEEYTDSEMESYSSTDPSWQQMIQDVEDEEDSDEEEWTPKPAKQSVSKKAQLEKSKKRRSEESTSDEISFPSMKKKRKAALAAEAMSHEAAQDEEDDDDEEDGDFVPAQDDDYDYDEEEEEEEDEEFDDQDDDDDFEQEEDVVEDKEEKQDVKDVGQAKVKTPKKEKSGESATPKQKTSPVKTPVKLTEQSQETPNSESVTKKKKKKKQKNKSSGGEEDKDQVPRKQLGMDNKENIQAQQKTPKSAKKQLKETKSPAVPKKLKLPSGTTIEDLKTGEGKVAKPGRKVFMYYRGMLSHNNKEFDSCLTGDPFIFNLGRGEVIRGWDEGVKGMKVGGKRRLIVPPSQGYGSQRMGPIPPNSTLVFDVELKQVR